MKRSAPSTVNSHPESSKQAKSGFKIIHTATLSRRSDIIARHLYEVEVMANELTVEQHMEMISSMVLQLLKKTMKDNGLNEKAFLGVSIASEGLDDALHLPFKKMDYYSGDYIINVLQNVGQSSRDVAGRLSRKMDITISSRQPNV